jgi:nitrite reductase/ring-hydroxylating ferredoxin subunit
MLDGFVPVATASELSPGAMRWVVVDRERVLLANVGGALYALRDACGHRQALLSKGR